MCLQEFRKSPAVFGWFMLGSLYQTRYLLLKVLNSITTVLLRPAINNLLSKRICHLNQPISWLQETDDLNYNNFIFKSYSKLPIHYFTHYISSLKSLIFEVMSCQFILAILSWLKVVIKVNKFFLDAILILYLRPLGI